MTASTVKKPKSKKLWIVVGVLVVVAIVGTALFLQRKRSLEITYREVAVTRGDLEVTILSTGGVQPENRLEIKPPVAGRIETVISREGDRVRKGQVLAWMSSSERAGLLDAARSKGSAEVKRWEDLYRPTPVLAPINGTIIQRNVESGQTFTAADAVFVMSDRLTVKAQVDETDISTIKLKQSAKIVLDAYPHLTIPAHVDQIAYDAKLVNNVTTYIVDVLPDETPPAMRSGMTANVTFLVASKPNVLMIPNDTLRVVDGKYSILTRVPDDDKPLEKAVVIGLTDGKRTEIVSGILESDTVLAAQIKRDSSKSNAGTNPFSPMGGGQPRRAGGGGGH